MWTLGHVIRVFLYQSRYNYTSLSMLWRHRRWVIEPVLNFSQPGASNWFVSTWNSNFFVCSSGTENATDSTFQPKHHADYLDVVDITCWECRLVVLLRTFSLNFWDFVFLIWLKRPWRCCFFGSSRLKYCFLHSRHCLHLLNSLYLELEQNC